MSQEITLDVETVARLIDGASHLYYPAFPDEIERQEIGLAVTKAEGELEKL